MKKVNRAARSLLLVLLFSAGAGRAAAPSLIGQPAPNFSRSDLDGRQVELSGYRGRVVLLNFWAAWCGPCLTEMPRFAAWRRAMGPENLQVIGVAMDDDPEPVLRVRQKLGVDFPILMGDAALGRLYGGILGLPVTFLIDRQGVLRARYQGESDLAEMEKSVRQLLTTP